MKRQKYQLNCPVPKHILLRVKPETLDALHLRAEKNGRTLNHEANAIIIHALKNEKGAKPSD